MSGRPGKSVGIARARRYDLPLEEGGGNGFLVLIVALMTFLAALAVLGAFALSALTTHWSQGLSHQVTVEVSAIDDKGQPRPRAQVNAATTRLAAMLRERPGVADVQPLDDSDIAKLVRPWLGGDVALGDLPVPGLISLTLENDDTATVAALGAQVATLDPRARVATYDTWLADILHFARGLQFAAALLGIAVGGITAVAVGAAVQARLTVSRENIEILYLMGATDGFISRQFQRHATRLALRGGVAGLVAAALTLGGVMLLAGRLDAGLLPRFSPTPLMVVTLAELPLFAAVLAALAAWMTVRRTLGRLP